MEGALDRARAQLAHAGALRAAINLANPLLVSGRTDLGDPTGLAPAMAEAVADRLGAPLALIPYPSPGAIADRVDGDEWDIALIGADPARARSIAFSPAYVEIEATFLVHGASRQTGLTDIDVDGTTIVAVERSAYDLWLRANVTHAHLVPAEDDEGAFARFQSSPDAVLAGLAPTLRSRAAELSGTARLVSGRFMTVQQAIGTHRDNDAGAEFLHSFVDEAKASGLVARLLARFGVESQLTVAR